MSLSLILETMVYISGSFLGTYLIPDPDIQGWPEKVALQHALDQVPPDAKSTIVNTNHVPTKLFVQIVENELEPGRGGGDTVNATSAQSR